MTTTTGSSIDSYFQWLREELGKRDHGKVLIEFTVTDHVVTYVRKHTEDGEKVTLTGRH